MSDRVHDFTGPPYLMDRGILRMMASCLTGDENVSIEESYALAADKQVGGDDALAGCAYGYLISVSTDPREVIERVICAADLLRQARRTMH